MKKIMSILVCLCMTLTLAACGGGGTDKGEGKSGKGDSAINVCFASEPATIDPALNSSLDGTIMLSHAFEGLIKYENDGEGNAVLKPGIAEKWDISDDKTTYTFHLREDAVWSDGEPLTSEDFMYAWNRIADPETAADYSYLLDPVKGFDSTAAQGWGEPEISAPDEHTFVVRLDVPTAYFEELCAFPTLFPVRKDVIEKNGDQWTFSPDTYVSNGPYKMKKWEHNSYILFEKNDSYYDADNVTAPEIKFQLMDDANAMLAGYQSGDLDFIYQVPPEEAEGLIKDGTVKTLPQLGNYYVEFGVTKKPFDDQRVRRAFALSIDRTYIAEKVKKDGCVPAGGFVPKGMYDAEGPGSEFREVGGDYYEVSEEGYKKNCDEARKLLAEAGYPEGKGFPAVEYIFNTDKGHKAIAEALQQMWKKELGVEVTLSNQDWNVFLEERKSGNFAIARGGWIADYNDPMCFLDMFTTGGGNNDPHYENPEYDALIGKAKTTADPAQRMKMLHEAEDIIVEKDAIVAPIYYYTQIDGDHLEGFYFNPLGLFFFKNAYREK